MGARIMGLLIVPNTHKPLLRRITLTNLLSFGPEPMTLELEKLNILIGPNGSGKSNLIEAISLLRATPVSGSGSDRDLHGVVRRGGGVGEWIWKGGAEKPASLEAVINRSDGDGSLSHFVSFGDEFRRFRLEDERIENRPDEYDPQEGFFYKVHRGQPVVNTAGKYERNWAIGKFEPELSILAQLRHLGQAPELSALADKYEQIRIYRDWAFGRNSKLREPQRGDDRSDRLEEDFSNLGLTLSRLRKSPKVKAAILGSLKDLYEGLDDFDVHIQAAYVEIFFTEGDFSVPAIRLSDGTLRYLCLLAILCDPDPPPLICIEEPELGLHPDILPNLADLLVEASQRTQLIVTTHSDILVDAMTERPEAVVICEKHNGRTSLSRLERADLAVWLDKYRLGQLWMRGQLGGTRW